MALQLYCLQFRSIIFNFEQKNYKRNVYHPLLFMTKKILLRLFLIKAVIFYIGWLILFHGFIAPSGTVNNFLTVTVAKGTAIGGELLGYDTHIETKTNKDEAHNLSSTVYLDGNASVLVADPCNGLELFALFIGFIVCFPGPIIPKVIFSVCGTLALFFVNILREIALAMNYLHFRSSFHFNHKYTYAIAVYVVVFLIWKYWLNHYSALSSKYNGSQEG